MKKRIEKKMKKKKEKKKEKKKKRKKKKKKRKKKKRKRKKRTRKRKRKTKESTHPWRKQKFVSSCTGLNTHECQLDVGSRLKKKKKKEIKINSTHGLCGIIYIPTGTVA